MQKSASITSKKRQEWITGLVSVVTPVYNGEEYLPRMLDSILGQTYPKMEMILVDDGSTDRTIEAAERTGEGSLNSDRTGSASKCVCGDQSGASLCDRGIPDLAGRR